jgi:hypothetical protein
VVEVQLRYCCSFLQELMKEAAREVREPQLLHVLTVHLHA